MFDQYLYTRVREAGLPLFHLGASWAFEATVAQIEEARHAPAAEWLSARVPAGPETRLVVRWSAGAWAIDAQTYDGRWITACREIDGTDVGILLDYLTKTGCYLI